ncbi:conserved hypothetical protein [Ricinus communis]|uniref:Uncharacterized protein n=1 Tax=Ricinus communis TaxID=3988 RepID=B9T9H4_RICCO|nr:conserved hypothetical protein [Ricinus communis]
MEVIDRVHAHQLAPTVVVAVIAQGAIARRRIEVVIGTEAGAERPAPFRDRRVRPQLGAETVAVVEFRVPLVQVVRAHREILVQVLRIADVDRERGIAGIRVGAHRAGQQGRILGLGNGGNSEKRKDAVKIAHEWTQFRLVGDYAKLSESQSLVGTISAVWCEAAQVFGAKFLAAPQDGVHAALLFKGGTHETCSVSPRTGRGVDRRRRARQRRPGRPELPGRRQRGAAKPTQRLARHQPRHDRTGRHAHVRRHAVPRPVGHHDRCPHPLLHKRGLHGRGAGGGAVRRVPDRRARGHLQQRHPAG